MKRWTILLVSLAAVFCLASCGAEPQEAAQETEEPSAETTTEPKQEEPKEKPQEESQPEPQEEPEEAPQEEPEEEPEDDDMACYEKVLDVLRSNVNNGFSAQMGDGVDPYDPGNVSEFFYMEAQYGSLSLGDIGYSLMDLNGDNIPELIVSLIKNSESNCGLIADLYTIEHGEVVHVLSSSVRNRYDLATDHSINFCGFGGAEYSQEFNFSFQGDAVALNFGWSQDGTQSYSHPKDSVIHSIKLSAESNPISEYYDPNSYYDYTGETSRQEISESEAETLRAQMPAAQSLDLTPISEPIQ